MQAKSRLFFPTRSLLRELNRQNYKLLAGAPVAREERIWVLRLPIETDKDCFNGYVPMSHYLPKAPLQN